MARFLKQIPNFSELSSDDQEKYIESKPRLDLATRNDLTLNINKLKVIKEALDGLIPKNAKDKEEFLRRGHLGGSSVTDLAVVEFVSSQFERLLEAAINP